MAPFNNHSIINSPARGRTRCTQMQNHTTPHQAEMGGCSPYDGHTPGGPAAAAARAAWWKRLNNTFHRNDQFVSNLHQRSQPTLHSGQTPCIELHRTAAIFHCSGS